MGIMQKKMETIGIVGYILGYINAIWGLYGDNGKEHGNYRDCRVHIGVYWGYMGSIGAIWG